MSIRPVSTTMGISTPASRAEGTGYYTYRGKQPHRPPRESVQLPQNVKASNARQKRIDRYCELRLAGKSRTEAGDELGVCDSTSKAYEAEFKDRQRTEAGDG